MQLKLVYRALRKISDLFVSGYYSDVYVEGEENVPSQGPLIIASTHHNEIIDIAALTVTIPHRHHVSFWAKSNMFVNPLVRLIMESSGAIPVYRNPDSHRVNTNANTSTSSLNRNEREKIDAGDRSSLRANLFRDTCFALSKGQVIGVFPEGTSYTEPEIVQILPGAARVAVEYARWTYAQGDENRERTGLKIIPVGIVYTDKSSYLSRVCVRYGEPIDVDEYVNEDLVTESDAVTKITEEIGRRFKGMTINAPDWETLFAAKMARSMLWRDETKILLKDWVPVSQALIHILLSDVSREGQLESVKSALTRYYALLHYTGIDHATLEAVLPRNTSRTPLTSLLRPSVYMPYFLLLKAIHLILFAPVLTIYGPAYLVGWIGGCFAPRDEECQAEFKGVFGGLGLGSAFALIAQLVWRKEDIVERYISSPLATNRALVALAIGYASFVVTIKWHNVLVSSNYNTLRHIAIFGKVFMGLILPSYVDVSMYSHPPLPRRNPFIKRMKGSSCEAEINAPAPVAKPLASWKLIRNLLAVREDAYRSLNSFLQVTDPEAISFLEHKGATIITD